MSCKKIIFLHLTLLLILCLTSCQKENFKIPKSSVSEENPSSTKNSNTFLKRDAVILPEEKGDAFYLIEAEEIVRTLILNTMFELYKNPELNDFGPSNTAEIRNACPDPTVNTNNNLTILTLNYGAGCATTSNAVYQGVVNVILDGPLHEPGTSVIIALSDNFAVTGVGDIDGTLSLKFDDLSTDIKYNILGISLTNIASGGATTVIEHFPNQNGFIEVHDVGNNDNTPFGLLDDIFDYNGCLRVICPSNAELQVCTGTDTPVKYTIGCGVPYEGEAAIAEEVNGAFNIVGSINFASPLPIGSGICDNEIKVVLNGNTTIIEL